MSVMSMREAYGRALAEYGSVNPSVVALDADTACSTLSSFFAARFPERFYNVGIAEPCLIDAAAGLALGGLIPFANGFASLLSLRALEQIRTCVAHAQTNVKIAASYAGVSDYKDGATHFSMTDIANLRALPGMTVIVPADAIEAAAWVPIVAEHNGPVYLRISRANTIPVHQPGVALEIGRGMRLRDGGDLTLVATGAMVGRSLLAAEALAQQGLQARVIEIHTIKPLDAALLIQAARETRAIVTVEEHSIIGGLGGAVAELLSLRCPTRVVRVGIQDHFCPTGYTPDLLMDAVGLSVQDIVKGALSTLQESA